MERTLPATAEERGPWSTGLSLVVALTPLAVGVAIAIAMDGKSTLGPIPTDEARLILLALAVLYPTVAAIACRMAYAPTTVQIIASVAPAIAYALLFAVQPLARDRSGHPVPLTPSTLLDRAGPPALLAAGTFVAVEIAGAAIKRGVAIGFFGAIVAAAVFVGSFWAGLLLFGPPATA